jgi:proteic killer suppression protein
VPCTALLRRGDAHPYRRRQGTAPERVWKREKAPRLGADLQRAAQKKLRQLNAAGSINDLRVPPGNRLEKLAGNHAGQHSIRINDQHRICFVWTQQGPTDVEINDYH